LQKRKSHGSITTSLRGKPRLIIKMENLTKNKMKIKIKLHKKLPQETNLPINSNLIKLKGEHLNFLWRKNA